MKKKSTYLNLNTGLGLAAVILSASIGTTLAGSIVINSNTEIEFGQGIVNTTACDNTITVTPNSKLESGEFLLDNIIISGISDYDCAGKYLTIKVLFDNIPQIIGSSSETACKFRWSANDSWISISGGCVVTLAQREGEYFTFTPGTDVAGSLVEKITLESSST